ncbi:DUF559 domain-containing protein [Nocardioides marmorisolisilvae]|nr:DUF559 domain-containing protein [Nocardioides marmorisolisilvae]
MDLINHMKVLGGAATRGELVERWGRAALERAVRAGTIVRLARGRYALAVADKSVRAAATYGGVVSMRSAANLHGWGQRLVPNRPDVTFPRNRRLEPEARRFLVPHWSDLAPEDVERGVTTKRRTLIDCMRNLPLADAVSIADSALRRKDITKNELVRLAFGLRGRGRTRAILVAAMATRQAANAFESTLRAIASTVPGLFVRPQQPVRVERDHVLHPDLIDDRLKIVIEAESFEWHDRKQLAIDCWRYNAFQNLGYQVIRFSWEQVILNAPYVVKVLVRAVRRAHRHANVAQVAAA